MTALAYATLAAVAVVYLAALALAGVAARADRAAEARRRRVFAAGRIAPRRVERVWRVCHRLVGGECYYLTTEMDSGRPAWYWAASETKEEAA